MDNTTDKRVAFLLASLGIGMTLFGHGAIRIPKLASFAQSMSEGFIDTPLPQVLVMPMLYVIPIVELLAGLLLLVGLFTRWALIIGSLLMITLIFGSSMEENWGAIPSQLTHLAFLAILLPFAREYNHYAIDRLFRHYK